MVCEHCGVDVPEGYGFYALPGEAAVCEECLYAWAGGFYRVLISEEAGYGKR